jgi:GAF domain-containing protein/HAMP domain-containing protein
MSASGQNSDEKMRSNAYRISLITAIALALASAASLVRVLQVDIRGISGVIVTGVIALIAGISAYLSSRGRYELGISLLLANIILAQPVLVVLTDNQSIAISILASIIVASISSSALPSRAGMRMILISIGVGVISVMIDLFTPNIFNLPSESIYTNLAAVILSLVYGFLLLRQFPTLSLRTKLIVSFVIVAAIPSTVLGVRTYFNTQTLLNDQLNAELLKTSQSVANRIDEFLLNQLDAIRTEAQIDSVIKYLELPIAQRAGSPEEQEAIRVLSALQRKNPTFISSYAILDITGTDILDTLAEDTGLNKADRDYFVNPVKTGEAFISPIRISQTTNKASLYFSAPVRNNNGEIIGVLRVRYSAAYLQAFIAQLTANQQEREYTVLVDTETYIRLAHTIDPKLVLKTFKAYDAVEINKLQNELRLPQGPAEDQIAASEETVQALQKIDTEPIFKSQSVALSESIFTGAARVKAMPWVVLNRRSEAVALRPITEQIRTNTLLTIAMLILASLAGTIVAQVLSNPLIALTQAARQVEKGELNTQAEITSDDEIGDLSHSFNKMTERLRDTLQGLEQRVAERTAEVEIARIQSEKRAQELQSISEISKVIAAEQNMEKLLLLITELVSEKFGFYHVGIFLLDNFRRFAILQAANSEGGKKMLARGHRLEVGHTGLVGYVAQSSRARIALDVGTDAVFFNNPDLPATRSEMALPLNIRGETIGVLDVQSIHPNAFSQRDANTLGVLADQIAIAIENARLFSQTQQALSEAQSLYNQYLGSEWARASKAEQKVGYLQSLVGGRVLDTAIDTPDIRQAVEKGDTLVITPRLEESPEGGIIIAPVKLRNQVIGVINVKSPIKGRQWNQDEVDMVKSISERLALTLETARLFSEARQRAEQERSISEISNKIISSTEVEEIMRTTVSELQKILGASEVFVKMDPPKDTVANKG